MKPITTEWMNSSSRLFGSGWVTNEMQIMKVLTQQPKMLPVSVEQARQQVRRLKEQSLSIVKKGYDITQS
ncbi:MAG: hypothetical protein ABIN01_02860 [Ferruginibacter sp.]